VNEEEPVQWVLLERPDVKVNRDLKGPEVNRAKGEKTEHLGSQESKDNEVPLAHRVFEVNKAREEHLVVLAQTVHKDNEAQLGVLDSQVHQDRPENVANKEVLGPWDRKDLKAQEVTTVQPDLQDLLVDQESKDHKDDKASEVTKEEGVQQACLENLVTVVYPAMKVPKDSQVQLVHRVLLVR